MSVHDDIATLERDILAAVMDGEDYRMPEDLQRMEAALARIRAELESLRGELADRRVSESLAHESAKAHETDNARLRSFVEAYDAWAMSPEHCGGGLFDAMLEARDALQPEGGS